MRRIVNHFNFFAKVSHRESNRLPSTTVPDMTLSLREQFDRWKSGGRVKSNSDELPTLPLGLDDFDIDNIHRMDKIDRELASRRVADFIAVSRGKLISSREQRFRDSIIEEHNKRLAAKPIEEGSTT